MNTRTKLIAGVVLSLFFVAGSARAALTESVFRVSPNGQLIAIIDSASRLQVQNAEGKTTTTAVPQVISTDIYTSPKLSWSADSKFLALEYDTSESERMVDVIDARTLKVIWRHAATSSAWSGRGGLLWVVPKYGIGETQVSPGLISFDPTKRTTTLRFGKIYFTGELQCESDVIVARVVRGKIDSAEFSVVRLDTKVGRIREIVLTDGSSIR